LRGELPFRVIVKLMIIVLVILILRIKPIRSTAKAKISDPESSAYARGKYIVEAVAICFECHSERDHGKPGSPIKAGMKGGGRILYGEGGPNRLVAPNISPDPVTGIGAWSDEDIIRAIRDGITPDGRQLNPEMPFMYYRSLSHEDLTAITLYLRNINPVRHRLPKNGSQSCAGKETLTPAMDRIHDPEWPRQVIRGEVLVRIATCETCHTPKHGSSFIPDLDFGGGALINGVASGNLTSDPSGISYYDVNQFIRVMRTGRVGARTLSPVMPWLFYRNMSETDLAAIFAYLQAVPPVKHRVSNTDQVTLCKKCWNRHGLGNLN
jgi:mono/diheme cytochrome c family protein